MTPEELDEAGIKTPMPGLWVWLLCWPLAIWIHIVTVWRNGKVGPDGS